jgi:hypothetical protein
VSRVGSEAREPQAGGAVGVPDVALRNWIRQTVAKSSECRAGRRQSRSLRGFLRYGRFVA